MHRRSVMSIVALAALVLSVMGGPNAWAQDPIHKLGRGAVNLLTGWIEIPKQLQQGTLEENPVAGAGRGLLRGVGLALLRVGVGLYEGVTFPLPLPSAYGSPYAPMELPDYAWE